MRTVGFARRLVTSFVAASAVTMLFTGHATAESDGVDQASATWRLREAVAGNPQAERAVELLLNEVRPTPGARQVALAAQPFQVPAESTVGRGGGAGMYGSGVALNVDGFRFGFFGGPGTIAPNQDGAQLNVVWVNLSNGRSGIEPLTEHLDVIADTTIRTRRLDPGPGMIVAAIYGSLWHRWPVPVSSEHPDGFQYVRSDVTFPSLGVFYN
ncbi:hypothetical protein [Nocardia paucivorans]|uniref:hypothetical protein n=1 Tax=Nocardia paucivorans TaxID=114259 RepID=UPI00030E8BB0|nr:hypothetical protein [Nocardia paucivorans]